MMGDDSSSDSFGLILLMLLIILLFFCLTVSLILTFHLKSEDITSSYRNALLLIFYWLFPNSFRFWCPNDCLIILFPDFACIFLFLFAAQLGILSIQLI